jgi:hypothetical protein
MFSELPIVDDIQYSGTTGLVILVQVLAIIFANVWFLRKPEARSLSLIWILDVVPLFTGLWGTHIGVGDMCTGKLTSPYAWELHLLLCRLQVRTWIGLGATIVLLMLTAGIFAWNRSRQR